MFYAEVTAHLLHDKEDPAVYLHSLRELLDKANPILSATAKDALLAHQFLTGLPAAMRLKLLGDNSTPKLIEMASYCKQLLAICPVAENTPSPLFCVTATTSTEPAPKDASLFSAVQDLTTAVKELQSQQKTAVAALSKNPRPAHTPSQEPKAVCCFLSKEM